MVVKFEFNIIDQEKSLSNGAGTTELNDPVMIYAQIPIERKQYLALKAACIDQKLSIYELLERALNQDPEEIQFIW